MADLRIRRLTAHAPPGRGYTMAARALDAMRLAAGTEDRFLIIRILALGPIASTAPAAHWHTQADQRLAALRATAVHGANPAAAQATSIWFASPVEARRLLLLELAAGRYPHAWFWPLAVPDWRGEDLSTYLGALVQTAETDPASTEFLARAVVSLVAAGALPILLRALLAASARRRMPLDAPAAALHRLSPTPHATEALRLLDLLPAPVRHVLGQAIASPTNPAPVRHHLARLTLQAVEPSLAGQAALADALATALFITLTEHTESHPAETPATRSDVPATVPRYGIARAAAPAQQATPPTIAAIAPSVLGTSNPPRRPPQEPPVSPSTARFTHAGPPIPEPASGEEPTLLAGLFLLLTPLIRLGLPHWLAAHPNAELIAFPRALLHHIATRHAAHLKHFPTNDPVFRPLAPPHPMPDLPAQIAWRVGLDRWLRRTTGRRMADIVRRRGWLLVAEDTLTIRYPLNAADLALRRCALDTDPGWLPWLGWSVTFHFRDDPLA